LILSLSFAFEDILPFLIPFFETPDGCPEVDLGLIAGAFAI